MSKHKFEDYHYDGISTLQQFYGEKLSKETNLLRYKSWKKVLGILEEVKGKQFYSDEDRERLNRFRKNYYIHKNNS